MNARRTDTDTNANITEANMCWKHAFVYICFTNKTFITQA